MNTSNEAVKQLEQALTTAQTAQSVIDNLVAPHDYQDVASLVTQAGAALLNAAALLLQKQDENAFEFIEAAEDLLDSVYDIIEGDIDE